MIRASETAIGLLVAGSREVIIKRASLLAKRERLSNAVNIGADG